MLDTNKKLWRWGPISGCPLYMHYTMLPSFAPMKELFGIAYAESYVIFQNNKVTWVMDDTELSEHSNKFVDQVLSYQEKLDQYCKLWDERTVKLQESIKEINSASLANLSNEKLTQLFSSFSQKYYDWWALTMSIELISVASEPRLGTLLKTYFPQEHPKDFNEAFALLSSSLTPTFYRQEERDLFQIAILPSVDQQKALEQHQRKYYWIYNSYLEAKIIDVNFFAEELKKISVRDARKAVQEVDDYTRKIVLEKDNLLNKINATSELRWYTKLVETTARLQDERKATNFQCDHYLELFADEFAKRTHISKEDIKFTIPSELAHIFGDNKLSLDDRKLCFVFHYKDELEEIITGEEALLINERLQTAKNIEASNIHGILASSGDKHYFRGIAKIVRTIYEVNKIEEGDILITTMTSPDFVTGMKKAGAVITDEGGMLCHAAVVSRELRKPCIVGTKIATKIIHDGDIVELHCGRGTVKLIKHEI